MGEQTVNFEIQIPPDQEVGSYANFLAVWSSPSDFTLDFAVTLQPAEDHENPGTITVPTRVVSRVKVPLHVVEDVISALSRHLNEFEDSAGRIWKPGQSRPGLPPQEQP